MNMETADKPHLPARIDKEQLKKAFDISHFDLNAVLRGVQLTLVGGIFDSFPGVSTLMYSP